MTRLLNSLVLTVILTLLGSASAVAVRIMDRDLQGLLGYGKSASGGLNLQIASGATGPVLVLLMNDDETDVIASYSAIIRGGQVVIEGAQNTTLSKVLSSRGVSLTITSVDTVKGRSYSLPGLKAPEDDKEKKDDKSKGKAKP